MGIYKKQEIIKFRCSATYLWAGIETPGVYIIEIEGEAQNFSCGFDLVRDTNFIGKLKVDVFGWTGPIGQGKKTYTVKGSFPGEYTPQIIISGSNGDFVLDVNEVPHNEVVYYIQENSAQLV